eukprot:SAG31_NODE_6839_length_1873_cov_6.338219_2_plen_107_part_00
MAVEAAASRNVAEDREAGQRREMEQMRGMIASLRGQLGSAQRSQAREVAELREQLDKAKQLVGEQRGRKICAHGRPLSDTAAAVTGKRAPGRKARRKRNRDEVHKK